MAATAHLAPTVRRVLLVPMAPPALMQMLRFPSAYLDEPRRTPLHSTSLLPRSWLTILQLGKRTS